jgi:hypothetical protein
MNQGRPEGIVNSASDGEGLLLNHSQNALVSEWNDGPLRMEVADVGDRWYISGILSYGERGPQPILQWTCRYSLLVTLAWEIRRR